MPRENLSLRQTASEAQEMEITASAPTESLDVLVVDDDPAGLCDLTASLERAGLRCVGVSSGWHALESLMEGTIPSVIVSDIRMPELDGLEFARRMRRMFMATPPEIVFISGGAELGHAVGAIRLRARDLLSKPIDLRRLIQIVKEVAMERHTRAGAEAKSLWNQNRAGATPDTRLNTKAIDTAGTPTVVLDELRKLRRVQSENLPAGLANETSWEILLDLYVSELRREQPSLTAVAGSAGIPLTSALRRIHELDARGIVALTPDEKDRRRATVHLTNQGKEAVRLFMNSYLAICRRGDSQVLAKPHYKNPA